MKWEREPEFTTANRAERCRVGDYELVAFDLPAGRAGPPSLAGSYSDRRRGVSRVTDDAPKISKHGPSKHPEVTLLTLNKLDAIDADRLHRKLGRARRASEEDVARRRYRLMCRVYLHLHRALMHNHQAAARPNAGALASALQ
jgi:hypothetical protein